MRTFKKFSWLIVGISLSVQGAATSFAEVTASSQEAFTYNDKGKRDPFWPLVTSTGSINTYETDFILSDLVLEGIMADKDANLAIINGRILKKNDRIGQFVVMEVGEDSVVLSNDDQQFELKLKKGE